MKRILLVVMMMFLVQSVAYADENKGKGEKFEKKKGKVIENINKRRGLLNKFEGCVKSAASREALKSCRKKHKEKMKAIRAETKERKEKRGKRRKERD
jgi:Tfp pilus assembly protein PilO